MSLNDFLSIVRTIAWPLVILSIGHAIAKAIARWGGPPRRGPRSS